MISGPRTYWHLEAAKRIPSDYEIASSRVLYYPGRGFEVRVPLEKWYARYQARSPFVCRDWEQFADPRATTYTTYTKLQEGQEYHVDQLLQAIDDTGSDARLRREWVRFLDLALAPAPFPWHGFQMIAAYVGHMAPNGRVTIATLFQAADEIRRVQRVAYRTRQLQQMVPEFGRYRRDRWQSDPAWQPLREAVERLLVTYDWGEAFVGLNLVLKPLMDELLLSHLGRAATAAGDGMFGLVLRSFNDDCRWHREWSRSLVRTVVEDAPSTRDQIEAWMRAWLPLACRALAGLAPAFDDIGGRLGLALPDAVDTVRHWYREQISLLGLDPSLVETA